MRALSEHGRVRPCWLDVPCSRSALATRWWRIAWAWRSDGDPRPVRGGRWSSITSGSGSEWGTTTVSTCTARSTPSGRRSPATSWCRAIRSTTWCTVSGARGGDVPVPPGVRAEPRRARNPPERDPTADLAGARTDGADVGRERVEGGGVNAVHAYRFLYRTRFPLWAVFAFAVRLPNATAPLAMVFLGTERLARTPPWDARRGLRRRGGGWCGAPRMDRQGDERPSGRADRSDDRCSRVRRPRSGIEPALLGPPRCGAPRRRGSRAERRGALALPSNARRRGRHRPRLQCRRAHHRVGLVACARRRRRRCGDDFALPRPRLSTPDSCSSPPCSRSPWDSRCSASNRRREQGAASRRRHGGPCSERGLST